MRLSSMAWGGFVVLLLFGLGTTVSGCRGCTESLNPESPEKAAELWGKLHCDRRESLVSLQITDLKNRKDILIVRSKLVAGGIDADTPVARTQALTKYIDDHGRELLVCEVEVTDRTARGAAGKEWVELTISYPKLKVVGDAFSIEPYQVSLGIEVTELDGAWRVTGEPAGIPTDAELGLFAPSEGDKVYYDPTGPTYDPTVPSTGTSPTPIEAAP